MRQRWSENQVTTLAPDASSLTAARKLAGKWTESGCSDTALWGLCKGSGKTPYQTIIDLTGPAFRCSCPSRKFPCKHALSLLLVWAGGAVTEAESAAEFATEWLGRRERKATDPPKKKQPASPAATDRRRERVAAGTAELDTWLIDQIRTGLARTDRSHAAFEAVAARMVDAQAPGLAGVLRRLPTAIVGRSDWPQILLGRFAWLRLLIAGHEQLDTLPAPLAATVRGHLGYPTVAESATSGPATTDRWLTAGIRTTEEDRLHTRASWLFGLRTGRWALILDRSHGAPAFPAQLPPRGLAADYTVHYQPVAAPLRAVVATEAGSDSGVSVPTADDLSAAPGSGTIAEALRAFATAAAADPWVESRPVLLRHVVPTRAGTDWMLAEPDGTALLLAEPAQPWRLLAVSGGRPVTVFGLWNGRRLEAISVCGDEEFHDAGPPAEPTEPAVIATAEAASIALLGTARGAAPLPGLPAAVTAAAEQLAGDEPARMLLDTTAMEIAWARGGYLPVHTELPAAPAEADPRPALPPAATDRLALLLAHRAEFLPEWFAAAQPHDYRAPDRMAGELLDLAARNSTLREPALRMAGARGRWVAERIPRWHALIRRNGAAAAPDTGIDIWELGLPPERIRWLAELRERDPAAARDTLAGTWPRESGAPKADLLAVLADGLGADDEELLERALGDRRGDVRRKAAELLAQLPGSAFATRMSHRVDTWLKATRGTVQETPELLVDIPADLAEVDIRDGFTDHGVEPGYRWNGQPDHIASRLRRLVALLPLDRWQTRLGAPAQAVTAGIDTRFRQPLFDGWLDAALAQSDSAWAAALFTAGLPSSLAILRRRELFALIPPADQAQHLLRLDSSWLSELESLLPAVARPWPPDVARHLLQLFEELARTAARRSAAPRTGPGSHRSLLHTATLYMPPDCHTAAAALVPHCPDEDWAMAISLLGHELHQRSTMLKELM